MDLTFQKIFEQTQAKKEIEYKDLPLPASKFSPVLSKDNLEIHHGTLYKNYVKKAHDTGDKFAVAGALLHTIFFGQLQAPAGSNKPHGEIKVLIEKKFETFLKFKTSFIDSCMSLKGSGWVYLSKAGTIKVIHNHEYHEDILLILDMWEHSYFIDYGADKEKYINSFFKVIDWSTINSRITNV